MTDLKKNKLQTTIAKYSVCFLVFVFFCVIIFFLFDKKSMMDTGDGLWQHYVYFIASGQLIRAFFKNIFVDHVFELPMWNMTMGMGSDQLISTVAANNFLFDPLYWVSAITPAKYSEYVFNIIVVLKLYISGIVFILFANEKGYKGTNALAGSLVYVFSSSAYAVFLEQSFSFSFIGFPLLLLGADRVWKRKGDILYVLVLCYCFIRSFYFTYMMVILLFAYCLIRYLCEKDHSIKKLFALIGRYTILSLISISIGIGAILPGLLNLSGLSRLENKQVTGIINIELINKLFSYAFSGIQAGGDAMIGVSSFAAVAAICLFVFKKKEPIIKWCFSLCLLSFAFPLIGSALNGFNYSSARYIFSLLLCVAYVVTVSFDSISKFGGKVWYLSLGISVIYCVICYLFNDICSVISALSLFVSLLLIGTINLIGRNSETLREKMYFTVIFISCLFLGYSCLHMYLSHMMVDSGSIYEKVYVGGGMNLRVEVNDPKYRTDIINTDFDDNVMNSSTVAEVSGYDFYHSNQNQNIENYYSELAVLGNPMGFSHTGFRSRCYAEILNACNYIVRSNDNNACIRAPYTYDFVKNEGDYSLYKSGRGVSLVYFYNDVISTETYINMDPVERETNLMYSMVVDDPGQTESDIVSDTVSVPFEITETNNITIDGNKVSVQEDGGYIVLKTGAVEAGQISVYVNGLTSSGDFVKYRNAIVLMDSENTPVAIDISAQYSTLDRYYSGSDDVVFSFESISEPIESIMFVFANKGEYNLEGIRIYSRPYEQMDKTIDAFYEHADMEDITYEYHGNHLNITATNESDRYLYIAIPYSEGWSAKVDGTPVDIIRANTAFMAISLPAGTHSIEMTYVTPHIYSGWTISAIGIILFICYLVFEKKRVIKKS